MRATDWTIQHGHGKTTRYLSVDMTKWLPEKESARGWHYKADALAVMSTFDDRNFINLRVARRG